MQLSLQISSIVEYVKSSIRGSFESAEWMDDDTRQRALARLSKLNTVVGFPSENITDNRLDEEYSEVILATNHTT